LNPEKKLLIAKKLDELGVHIIEAGSAIASEGEINAIRLIVNEKLNAEICSFARALIPDIDAVIQSEADSIHLVVPTSPMHYQYKLQKTPTQILDMTVEAIQYAKDHGLIIEFSAEDATRSELPFLKRVFQLAETTGADRLCACDTVGVLTPEQTKSLFTELTNHTSLPISVHCHDDFGMAVANSIAGLQAGAQGVHATVNGLGERAGNASLEEIVMALYSLYQVKLPIKTQLFNNLSNLVSRLTGVPVQPNKAIVGENAFTHEAGIHTHGVTSHPLTYEPINPELVGRKRTLIAGKHAGMHGIQAILIDFGLRPSAEQLRAIVERAKELGDHGKIVTDNDLLEITFSIMGVSLKEEPIIRLTELAVMTGTKMTPTASVRVIMNDRAFTSVETGVGPVDAAMKALQKLTRNQVNVTLREYRIEALTGGSNAVAEVIIKVEDMNGNVVSSRSANEDIVKASVNAMIIGINRLLTYQKYYGSN
jgi:isopropylmalate/citramalate/homocitrate synthase-like protein